MVKDKKWCSLTGQSDLECRLLYEISEAVWKRRPLRSFQGEAYFDVAKNKDCPFIIQSQDYKIRVLGTTFNLNNYEDSEELQLTLCTGKVLMNFGEEQLKLTHKRAIGIG